jgi:hypothetical protein
MLLVKPCRNCEVRAALRRICVGVEREAGQARLDSDYDRRDCDSPDELLYIDLVGARLPSFQRWYGQLDTSPFHSLDFGVSLARRIPRATRTVVDGGGGSILWTHCTQILKALLEARRI